MKKKYNYTDNLLVSFSGGETSAFMSQWLLKHYKEYGYKNIVFVFANTGQENEQTLEFVERCDMHFGFKLHWVEALVYLDERKSSGYTLTDFQNAKRKGEPFIEVIKKYGIPNMSYPHCTRELKQNPISAFGKVWFNGEDYDTAIGIRIDEFARVKADVLAEKSLLNDTGAIGVYNWLKKAGKLNGILTKAEIEQIKEQAEVILQNEYAAKAESMDRNTRATAKDMLKKLTDGLLPNELTIVCQKLALEKLIKENKL